MNQLRARGAAGMPLIIVQHPLGGERAEGVQRRVHQGFEQLTSLLGHAR